MTIILGFTAQPLPIKNLIFLLSSIFLSAATVIAQSEVDPDFDPNTPQELQIISSYGSSLQSPAEVHFPATVTGNRSGPIYFTAKNTGEIDAHGISLGIQSGHENDFQGVVPLPEAEPFGDGVANLLKYAFKLDLAGPDSRRLERGAGAASGLPAVELDDTGESPELVFEFLRRRNSGLVYQPKFSTGLESWTATNGGETVEPINDEWERVTVSQPADPGDGDRMFGKVTVELP